MWVAALLLLSVSSCYANSIQFLIHQRKTECFYLEKEKGDMIEVWVEVADGKSQISFAIFDNKDKIIHHESSIKVSEVNMQVNTTGPYAFCFGGRTLTSSVAVHFDFQPQIQARTKKEVDERFSMEKRRFLNKVLHNVKFDVEYQKPFNLTEQFMMDVVRHHKNAIVVKNPNVGIENSLMYLSILADRMIGFMEKHKVQMRKHSYLQENNQYDVTLFSSIISCSIIAAACVQLIVLKSFFTGTISLKLWQF